ncbi:MAG TPA: response regulator transcription factor [Steroidobacteraceae bacterium]
MEAQPQGSGTPVRVLLASDICVYREALSQVLKAAEGIELVGTAGSSAETLDQVQSLLPSVVLLDIGMADACGAAKQIVRLYRTTHVVALGVSDNENEIITCVEMGISGYVPRDGSVPDMLEAIRAAARGEVSCSPKIAGFLFRRIAALSTERNGGASPPLTAREAQIVQLLQQGLSNKMISRSLGIELPTVKNHIHSIFAKLGVHRRAEAVSLLYRQQHDDNFMARRGNAAASALAADQRRRHSTPA